MAAELNTPTPDPFWAKVKIGADSECWPWQRFRNSQGYGKLTIRGETNRNKRAHRIAFELVNGPIPKGLGIAATTRHAAIQVTYSQEPNVRTCKTWLRAGDTSQLAWQAKIILWRNLQSRRLKKSDQSTQRKQ
jgi:hypothetical protein